ncbi:MAG: hypothetical protein AAGK37_10305 [Pseudomonadota bacterium]
MRSYEFRVVPVPARSERKLAEPGQDPLTATIETAMNAMAVEGWEYLRSESFTMARGGWFRRGQVEKLVMVFRRERMVLTERADTAAEKIEQTRSRKSRADQGAEPVRPRRIDLEPTAASEPVSVAAVAA